MPKDRPVELDAFLLRPLLDLEARLRRDDEAAEHELDDGRVRLVRGEHDVRLDSDECELILPTDAPIRQLPDLTL